MGDGFAKKLTSGTIKHGSRHAAKLKLHSYAKLGRSLAVVGVIDDKFGSDALSDAVQSALNIE